MDDTMQIWPDSNQRFWDIRDPGYIVEIEWSGIPFEDYRKLAQEYIQCGYLIFEDVIKSGHNNIKSDMLFLSGIFSMRHGLELGLKALLCRICNRRNEIQRIFEECCHDLSCLFRHYWGRGEYYLIEEEKKWLENYLLSVEDVDEKSDMFRFPFEDEFLSRYKNKFLDNVSVANNMVQACCLIKKCIDCGRYDSGCQFDADKQPEFLVFASHGIGNCHLWVGISDHGFQTKITGYTLAAVLIFDSNNIALGERLYPLIFLLRNAIELCLKRLFYARVGNGVPEHVFFSKRRSHLLKKDLWKNICPMIEYYADENGEDLNVLDIVEARILEIDAIDKKGDSFRYPTTYSLEYRLNNKKIDVKNVFEYMKAVINFLEACDMMLDEISEYESEMRSYYIDYCE